MSQTKVKSKRYRNQNQMPVSNNNGIFSSFAKYVTIFVIGVLCIGVSYLFLTQKISDTDKAIRETENEIARITKEIANLRNQEANLKGSKHIRQQIARFKLDLHNYERGQVTEMRILSNQEAAAISAQYERKVRTAINYKSQ